MTPEETEQQRRRRRAGREAREPDALGAGARAPRGRRSSTTACRPGSVLNEVALSRSLGVCRGPVREALGRLAAEGLVTIRPRRGAVVSALSAQEFLEAYQVREALETLAIRLAVPRLGPDELARLQALVDEMVVLADAADVDAFFRANAAFHAPSSRSRATRCCRSDEPGCWARWAATGCARSPCAARCGARSSSTGRSCAPCAPATPSEAERLLGEHIRVPQRRLEAATDEEVVVRNAS